MKLTTAWSWQMIIVKRRLYGNVTDGLVNPVAVKLLWSAAQTVANLPIFSALYLVEANFRDKNNKRTNFSLFYLFPNSLFFFLMNFSSISSKSSFDRNQKPQYDRSDSLLAGSLRTVIIPQTMEVFLKLAQRSTDKYIETCSILAGRLCYSMQCKAAKNNEAQMLQFPHC
ncbi:uncharacterized protein LOC119641097 isoform X1 [Glossina fuscipes]|uniref:Uncharacterized protein LOC119641097 isoform X1 n=1 Tax=Glossina fuscipes TaxID=7396 RepID=A0A9C5ZB73_9MUSC|nr:uncharacterized protein LOC119641097 isoform X1 [Glossina fuscipes]